VTSERLHRICAIYEAIATLGPRSAKKLNPARSGEIWTATAIGLPPVIPPYHTEFGCPARALILSTSHFARAAFSGLTHMAKLKSHPDDLELTVESRTPTLPTNSRILAAATASTECIRLV